MREVIEKLYGFIKEPLLKIWPFSFKERRESGLREL